MLARRPAVRPWRLSVGLLLVSFILANGAAADQWYISPQVSLRTLYDDNVRLLSVNPVGSFGTIARADAKFGRRTEISNVDIDAGLSNYWYANVSELNTTNGYLGLNSAYQLERSRLGLDARVDYDSSLTSEIATSGLVQVNKRQTRLFVKPSWSYSLSERSTLDLSASYTNVSYEDVQLIPLYNYRVATLDMNGTYLWSERTQLFARLSYQYYDADKVDTRSNSIGLMVGGAYALSESMSLTALAGVRVTSQSTPTLFGSSGDQTSIGPLVDLKLEKRFEVGKLSLDVSQTLLPSSTGELLNTTAGAVALDYPITPRWSFDLNANAYINRYPGGGANINDRNYFDVSPKLTRKLSEWWQLDLAYRFRYQKYQGSANQAVSNAVLLTLRYTWPTEPVGRWSLLH
jgi:hypothetical protein